jgi:hypothetical protein
MRAQLAENVKPLQFGPSGNHTFDAAHENNHLLSAINSQVALNGHKYGLKLNDYAVIKNDDENNGTCYVVSKDIAKEALKNNEMLDINRVKYGLMGVMDGDEIRKTRVPILSMYRNYIRLYEPYSLNVIGYGVGHGSWLPFPWWFGYMLMLMELAVGCHVYRDASSTVAIVMMTTAPALLISLLGPDGGMMQIFAWYKVISWGVTIAWYYISPSNGYVLAPSLLMNDVTTMWMQDATLVSPALAGETQFFTWFFFGNVVALMIKMSYTFFSAAASGIEFTGRNDTAGKNMPMAPKKRSS